MTTPRAAVALAALLTACPAPPPVGFASPPVDGAPVTDPVDRRTCAKTPGSESAVFDAKTYYFCGPDTAATFRKTPEKHADRRQPTA